MQYVLNNDILDLAGLQEQISMSNRSYYLSKHLFDVYQGKDGYWKTYLPNGDGRKRVQRKNKKDLEDLIIAYWKEQELNPSFEECFIEWNDRRRDLNQISKATYTRNKYTYNRHCKEFGKIGIKDITEDMLSDFLEEQIYKHKLTAKGFANLKGIIKGTIKRAKKKKFTKIRVEDAFDLMDITEKSFAKKVVKENTQVFTEDELPRLVNYLTENSDNIRHLGILLMLVTGIRVGELVGLKYEDFIDDTSFGIYRSQTKYKTEDGKVVTEIKEFPKTNAGIRTIIIPNSYKWVIKKIRRLNPFGEYLMMDNDKHLTTESIRKRQYRVCDELGIDRKSSHKCRKTFASILKENGVDDAMIISQMGHASIGTTNNHYIYNRKNITHKKNIISNIPEFNDSLKVLRES